MIETYNKNKAEAQVLRKLIKINIPNFNYRRVYTEKRKNGVCRTKFWRMDDYSIDKLVDYLTQNVPYRFKIEPMGPYRSVAIFIS